MTAPSDEQIRLAWHDAVCERGKVCPRRGAHANELPRLDLMQLRGFVDVLFAVPDEVSPEDLRRAEHRLHLMWHIAQADGVQAAMVGLRNVATLLWAARNGKLADDPLRETKRVSADELAAAVLGYRDDVPNRCMEIMDGQA